MTKLEKLAAAHEAATNGEWERSGAYLIRKSDGVKLAQSLGYVGVSEEMANLKFAALAHNLMPNILGLAAAARNVIDSWERGDLAEMINQLEFYLNSLESN